LFTIIQIGELAKKFSKKFLAKTIAEVPWKEIMQTGDRYIQGYYSLNLTKVWETVIKDIPVLETFCKKNLKELQTLEVNNKTSSAKITTEPTPDPDPNHTPRFKS
jgi:uncharacterized protein with HEPN domain